MNNPKNHHYIPQSYLKNFSFREKVKHGRTEFYVHVYFKGREFDIGVHKTNLDFKLKNLAQKISQISFYPVALSGLL